MRPFHLKAAWFWILLAVLASPSRAVAVQQEDAGVKAADSIDEFATGVATPHSVTWHGGALYAGVPTGVVELKDTDGDGKADARRTLIDDYGTDGHSTPFLIDEATS